MSETIAKLVCIIGMVLATAMVLAGACLLRRSVTRKKRGGSSRSKVPAPPGGEPPNINEDDYLDAFYAIFRWFLQAIRITMKEIVREHLVCRRAMRHHRDTLRTVMENAEEKHEDLAKWAGSDDGDWASYRDSFGEAVRDLNGAIEPLSRWFGCPIALMLQAAGQLCSIIDKLDAPHSQLQRVRRDLRRGDIPDNEDLGGQEDEENGNEAEG